MSVTRDLLEMASIVPVAEEIPVGLRAKLTKLAKGAETPHEARDILEEWGIAKLNYSINRQKSIRNIIAELVSKHESKRKKMINAWNNK